MFCSKCGTQLPDGSVFCSKCGAQLGEVKTTEPSNSVTFNIAPPTNSFEEQIRLRLQQAVDTGDIETQLDIAVRYIEGNGVKQDDKTAFELLSYIAGLKNVSKKDLPKLTFVQRLLGDAYNYGKGVGQDYNKAMQWYYTASKNGDFLAAKSYGDLCYSIAQTHPQGSSEYNNYMNEAVATFTAICEGQVENDLKMEQAQVEDLLGGLFMNGIGVCKDVNTARKYFSSAAQKGHPGSERMYADITASQGEYKTARHYYYRAYKHNDPYSAFWYGVYAKYGIHGNKDKERAKIAFDFAFANGDVELRKKITDERENDRYKSMARQMNKSYNPPKSVSNSQNSGCVVMLPIIGVGFSSIVGLFVYLIA